MLHIENKKLQEYLKYYSLIITSFKQISNKLLPISLSILESKKETIAQLIENSKHAKKLSQHQPMKIRTLSLSLEKL